MSENKLEIFETQKHIFRESGSENEDDDFFYLTCEDKKWRNAIIKVWSLFDSYDDNTQEGDLDMCYICKDGEIFSTELKSEKFKDQEEKEERVIGLIGFGMEEIEKKIGTGDFLWFMDIEESELLDKFNVYANKKGYEIVIKSN